MTEWFVFSPYVITGIQKGVERERERKEKVVCMWLEHFLFTVKYIYYTFSVYVHNGSKKKFNDQV